MSPADFATWLRGFLAAVGSADKMTAEHVKIVYAELQGVRAAPAPSTDWSKWFPPAPNPSVPDRNPWPGLIGGPVWIGGGTTFTSDRTVCGGGIPSGQSFTLTLPTTVAE